LKQAFENNYAHTGRMEEARANLTKLKMEGDLIDDYISSFENLLSRGEIPRSEVGAIEKFKDGLKYGVLATILRRDTWPTTIDEWEEAARREVRRFRVIKESLRRKGDTFGNPRTNKWNSDFQNALRKQKKGDVVPMEIDAASMEKPSKQKWSAKNDKLKKEGRCFKCQKPGHMKKDCPEWGTTSKKPLARVVEAEENEPKEGHQVARVIKAMDDQQREDLLDAMINETGF
jgi:Zinc knuckle